MDFTKNAHFLTHSPTRSKCVGCRCLENMMMGGQTCMANEMSMAYDWWELITPPTLGIDAFMYNLIMKGHTGWYMNKTCLPIAMQLCERVNEHCTTIRKKLMILFFCLFFLFSHKVWHTKCWTGPSLHKWDTALDDNKNLGPISSWKLFLL